MNIDFPALPTAITAVLVAVITYLLTQRREHKSEWRKIKFAQYQEYLRALSGIVEGRSTAEAQDRYSDAANGMLLVSSLQVMRDLNNYLSHNSYLNKNDWSIWNRFRKFKSSFWRCNSDFLNVFIIS